MCFFFFEVGIVERIFLEHDKFPSHVFEGFELDLVYFVMGFSVDEEVFVVEEGIHQQVWTVFYIIDLAS